MSDPVTTPTISTAVENPAPKAAIPAAVPQKPKGFTRDNGNTTLDGQKHLIQYDASYTEDVCPGCSYDIAHDLYNEDGKRIVECTCCETSFVSGAKLAPLSSELSTLFQQTKEGEKVIFKKPHRGAYAPDITRFANEDVLFTRGGLSLPATKAGFVVEKYDRVNGSVTLLKPIPEPTV
jgi:Zn ribbon nucleic-acid-binding protein